MKGLLLVFVFASIILSSIGFVDVVSAAPRNATLTKSVSASCPPEVVNLATSARKLYMFDPVNLARIVITSGDMPNTLAGGTITDLSGYKHTYSQSIRVGSARSDFSTSMEGIDPVLLYQVGTDPQTVSLYRSLVSFSPGVDFSSIGGAGNQNIRIIGKDYVVSTQNNPIVLYGGQQIGLLGGDVKNVIVNGVSHTVELVSTTNETARILFDGVTRIVYENVAYGFSGNVVIYVKDIHHPSFPGDIRSVDLVIDNSLASPIAIYNGSEVSVGTEATRIRGTRGEIEKDSQGKIASFSVSFAMQSSQKDHVALGESFLNPVFGTLSFVFDKANPNLNDASRNTVKVRTDNNQYAYVTLNSARSGAVGSKELTYAYDSNTNSTGVSPILAHQYVSSNGRGRIYSQEGASAKFSDWIILNQNDSGTIVEVTDLTVESATSGKASFQDVITGEFQTITLTNMTGQGYIKAGVNFYGGSGYTVRMDQAGTSVSITWNSGTTAVFPRIKLRNGGWMAFLTATKVSSSESIILPSGLTNLPSVGQPFGSAGIGQRKSLFVNGINWTGISQSSGTITIDGISVNSNLLCDFSAIKGPAILIFEPKKWNDFSYGDYICIPMTTTGVTEIAIGDPAIDGVNSGYITLTSDTYQKQAVDQYGTLFVKEDRTNENGVATIKYPNSQMYLDALLTAPCVNPSVTRLSPEECTGFSGWIKRLFGKC